MRFSANVNPGLEVRMASVAGKRIRLAILKRGGERSSSSVGFGNPAERRKPHASPDSPGFENRAPPSVVWVSEETMKTTRATFFSARHEADVHLLVHKLGDNSSIGIVTCGDDVLAIGQDAEQHFHTMFAEQEAYYAITRARVRAAVTLAESPNDE